jgi:hypothetical protein
MKLTPGSRWKSAVCNTEVVLVKPPKAGRVLECGGVAMMAYGETKPEGLSPSAMHSTGSLAGKRYSDEASNLEVLCSKSGLGSLSLDGLPLIVREAKRLPSSD